MPFDTTGKQVGLFLSLAACALVVGTQSKGLFSGWPTVVCVSRQAPTSDWSRPGRICASISRLDNSSIKTNTF